MEVTQHYAELTRKAISSVLAGSAPNGTRPEDCGPWAPAVQGIFDGHADNGTAGALKVWATLSRDKALAAVLAADPKPEAFTAKRPSFIPDLPPAAQAIYAHASPCGYWLDRYIAFASKAAPMTPRSFHEAAGLFAVAVAVARRLVLRVGTTSIYPNLFVLFLAPSTLYRKTTGLRVLTELFEQSNLGHLLLPQRMTPEAVVQELGLGIPPTLDAWDSEARSGWLKERAFAARRGWVLDEASSLFDGLKRDYNAGLMGLMLNMYECPAITTDQTIGRGRTTVRDAYISFFGVATPAAINEHLSNNAFWTNGLWARFALIMPDERPDWNFFPPALELPRDLVITLEELHYAFPVPSARILTTEQGKEKDSSVVIDGDEPPMSVTLAPGVWQAWEAYAKALSHDLLMAGNVDNALFASYGRLATQAIKVSMLLATMDTERGAPITIELRHFARAQQVAEVWRTALHHVHGEGAQTESVRQSDKVLMALSKGGELGILARDIYRPMNMSPEECNAALTELEKAGQAERIKARASNGRAIERWRIIPGAYTFPEVHSVSNA